MSIWKILRLQEQNWSPCGIVNTQQVSPESGPRLLTSLTTTVFTPAARALAQKNNMRLIDGNELVRLEKARQASGDEERQITAENRDATVNGTQGTPSQVKPQ
jgi:hypothetical protein